MNRTTTKNLVGSLLAGAVLWMAFSTTTTPPDAEAAQCAAPLQACGETCYNVGSQRCYAGTVCSGADQYCQGAHGCFDPGTQKCCPTTVVSGGASCPNVPSYPSAPKPGSGDNRPPQPINGGGSQTPYPGVGIPYYTANILCPTASSVTIVHTPVAPAGWTAAGGTNTGAHPTSVPINADRVVLPNQSILCWYGVGGGESQLTSLQTGKKCDTADDADGFYCR